MKSGWHIFVIFALFTACSVQTGEDEFLIIPVADHLNETTKIQIDELGKTIRYVQLETNDDILIGYVQNVIMTDNRFYIIHNSLCSVFDLEGNYLNNIGRKGEGPDEYLYISKLFVRDNIVTIYDSGKMRLQHFSLTGELLGESKLPSPYNDLFCLSDGKMLGYMDQRTGEEKIMGYVWDGKTEIDSIAYTQTFTPGKILMIMYNAANIFSYDNKDYYKNMLNDTLFRITENYMLQPVIHFDQGKYSVIGERRYQLTDPAGTIWNDMGLMGLIGESKDFLFFTTRAAGKNNIFCWNKQEKTLANLDITYPQELVKDQSFIPRFLSEDKKFLFSPLILEDSEENPVLVLVEL